jgi:hypothetical protein
VTDTLFVSVTDKLFVSDFDAAAFLFFTGISGLVSISDFSAWF